MSEYLFIKYVGRARIEQNWAELVSLAERGDMEQIKQQFPREYLLNQNAIRRIRHCKKTTLSSTRGIWIYGPSGCGKSSGVREAIDPGNMYEKLCNKWWDDYNEEPVILLDDVDKSMIYLGQFIKRWCDHYPFRGEYKGGSRMYSPEIVVITSQYMPHEIWADDAELVSAIERRCLLIDMTVE